jgi:glucose-6-phosphate 1-epimerase
VLQGFFVFTFQGNSVTFIQLPSGMAYSHFAGYPCVRLENHGGVANIALHGGQLLSWVPAGQRDVFWLSPQAQMPPAALRGGVPVCWPWFGRQGMPPGAMQHGPVRNMAWKVVAAHSNTDGVLHISLQPDADDKSAHLLANYVPDLQVRLDIAMGQTLTLRLHTHNAGATAFTLQQALHAYFAVGGLMQIQVHGLQGLAYVSQPGGIAGVMQQAVLAQDFPCDMVFQHTSGVQHDYTLLDPAWGRAITIATQGSQSLVVWNPGAVGAAQLVDMPNEAWQDFLCLEASNAGADAVVLQPGGNHTLQQVISSKPIG